MNFKKEIENVLDEYKDIPLSDNDIMELLKGKTNIILYSSMHKYDNVNQLIDPYGCCVILYEAKPHSGHWCCLTLHDKELEFFDSYGGEIDTQLDYIPKKFAEESNQDYPYLLRLIAENNEYDVSYNEFDFQELNKNVKTCGRWTCLRIMLKELPLNDFRDLFFNEYSDDLATFLTADKNQLL